MNQCPRCGFDNRPGALNRLGPFEYMINSPGVVQMPDRDPLLVEREKTHGPFANNAQLSQQLKSLFRDSQIGYGDQITKAVYCESLDMIALKLSRILTGQANFKDHWDDIAGYAKLASEACDK